MRTPPENGQPPTIIPRADHVISRANISKNALNVLYHLKESGYQAYLVGGGVRDLLLGREPKDFDVATDARPEEIRKIFRNCRLIGRRFRLAHIHFGREIIEVATFRTHHEGSAGEGHVENGMIVRDNVYGTLEDDAWRRDFTVNSLYYNIEDFSVVDYTGGFGDLEAGTLRLIGDPRQRYQEDPVRMLRAVRFAVKLGFRISPESEEPIFTLAPSLRDVSPARLYEEVLKLLLGGTAQQSFEALRHYRLFEQMFPMTEQSLSREVQHFPKTFLIEGMRSTDQRIAEDKPVTPAFMFAVLLWEPVSELAERYQAEGMTPVQALVVAGDEVVAQQIQYLSLPKRFSLVAREIWSMQIRLTQRKGKRAFAVLAHPRFRAAYDFLLLRVLAGEGDQALGEWWTDFQTQDEAGRQTMINALGSESGPRRRRRRPQSKTKPSSS
ncbi:MAG: poly(A) polymerase [Gammaproteobacteria bacterium RBG_16_57_12]|nr:MAG: poly(A) polymerase [Gammaproteobacteria bacterium RBG_16_57_12]